MPARGEPLASLVTAIRFPSGCQPATVSCDPARTRNTRCWPVPSGLMTYPSWFFVDGGSSLEVNASFLPSSLKRPP